MLGSILITILVVILWRFIDWVWITPKRMERILRKQGLKGNVYRFLFGDARETAKMYKESYSKPIGIFDDLTPRVMPFITKTIKTYGENSFMWVGPRPQVFITDATMMKTVMNKYHVFHKSFKISNPIFRRLIGGLVRFEGEKWRKTRRKLNPLFHLDKLKEMVPMMQNISDDILDQWESMLPKDGSSGEIDVFPYFVDYTASVVAHTLFGTSYNATVKRAFYEISELTLLANQAQPFSVPGEQYVPTKRYKRADEIEKDLRTTFTNMINERLKKRKEPDAGNRKSDLFDMVLDEMNVDNMKYWWNRVMVVREVIQQCKLFFIAGHETTAMLCSWTTVMLAVHQDWQARAREEILQVLGDNDDLKGDNVGQLKILHMIVHEVLRLYPPSVELSRVVEEETELGEYRIPKGVMLMLPTIWLHRNPKIWGDDALEFKPERFSEGALKAANGHAAFIPFGWGQRTCIGSNMSLFEAKVFFTLLLRKYSVELSPNYKHGPLVSLTMQPQYGVPIIFHKLN